MRVKSSRVMVRDEDLGQLAGAQLIRNDIGGFGVRDLHFTIHTCNALLNKPHLAPIKCFFQACTSGRT